MGRNKFKILDETLVWPFKWKVMGSIFSSTVYYAVQFGSCFKSVDETLLCDHSNESYWAVLSFGTVYYAVQGGSNFYVCGWKPSVWPFKWKLLSRSFKWYSMVVNMLMTSVHVKANILSSFIHWRKCQTLMFDFL